MGTPSVIGNLKTANQGVFFLLLLALPFDNALFHFASLCSLIMAFISLTHTGWPPAKNMLARTRNVQLAFLFVTGVMVMSNLWNHQNDEAWRTLVIFVLRYWFLLLIILYLYESRMLSPKNLLAFCLGSIAVQLLPFMPHIVEGVIFKNRFEGFSSNPNIIGLYAGFGIVLGVYWLTSRPRFQVTTTFLALSFMTLSCLILLASGSRASWVATLAALLAYSVFDFKRNYKILLVGFVVLGAATFGVFNFYPLPLHRLELLLNGYPSLRDEVWQNSLNLFRDKPILGYGLDTREVLLLGHKIYSEHNVFLSVLLALGVMGFFAYLHLLFRICWPAWLGRNYKALSLMSFLMVAGMFGFDFYRDQHFMVIFVLISSVCLFHPSSRSSESDNVGAEA